MYINLDKELAANKISWRTAASIIEMPESTFRYKMTEGEFTVLEAFKIKNRILPKYTLEYIFEKNA